MSRFRWEERGLVYLSSGDFEVVEPIGFFEH